MARPLSEDKRNALLAAATHAIAALGVAASTVRIAKDAGVAEGTLFIYFPTKDDLFNQLYLDLKSDLIGFLRVDYPSDAGIPAQIRHIWDRFIDWGAVRPEKRKALRQLSVSEKITEATQKAVEALSHGLQTLMEDGIKTGILRDQSISFLAGIVQALAELVLEKVAREPGQLEEYKNLGWEALWGAIGRR